MGGKMLGFSFMSRTQRVCVYVYLEAWFFRGGWKGLLVSRSGSQKRAPAWQDCKLLLCSSKGWCFRALGKCDAASEKCRAANMHQPDTLKRLPVWGAPWACAAVCVCAESWHRSLACTSKGDVVVARETEQHEAAGAVLVSDCWNLLRMLRGGERAAHRRWGEGGGCVIEIMTVTSVWRSCTAEFGVKAVGWCSADASTAPQKNKVLVKTISCSKTAASDQRFKDSVSSVDAVKCAQHTLC